MVSGSSPEILVSNAFPAKKQNDMTSTDQERWQRVKNRLRSEVGDDVFTSWFARMELDAVDKGAVRLSVPTRFLRNWIQSHYSEKVLSNWQAEDPSITRLELSVRSATMRSVAVKPRLAESTMPVREPHDGQLHGGDMRANGGAPFMSMHEALGGSPLDPRLTFDTFIVGRSNTLAHAAARQVAASRRGDQLMFNPLYVHAGVGLGKTHLLQAVTWTGNGGDRKVLYLTAERFMYGFVSALRNQNTLAFKEAVRAIDVLIIDDLQFLQGRSTQAEFCHTLNTLIDAGRQVVIASDRPPADLESLDDRVRSRLAGGLVVEVGSLGEELRLEILNSRVNAARAHQSEMRQGILGEPARKKLAEEYLRVLERHCPGAQRVVDKTLINSDYLGFIHSVFPNARIIRMRRDPIDTCLSCYFQHFSTAMRFSMDLNDLADFYRVNQRLMNHWCSALPAGTILEVPYEELVVDQEAWTRKILDFLGLEWDERCLSFHETKRAVNTSSAWQVRQKIYTQSSGRWRNYEKFIGPLKGLRD